MIEPQAEPARTRTKRCAKKRVLIISYPTDLHARAVAYAIRAKGHIAVEFFFADYPTLTTVSFAASGRKGNPSCVVDCVDGRFDLSEEPFDAVWVRRIRRPWLPSSMHPGDREIATRQCDNVLQNLVAALDNPAIFWVNRPETETKSLLKFYQLRAAQDAGLKIPDTLVSNDPGQIRQFITECGGTSIYKEVEHSCWAFPNNEQVLVCYTTPVTCKDLPRDTTLRLCPGIFQPLLSKKYEVRVACFGDYLMSVQIDSQSDERARIDWRAGQWYIGMNPYELPNNVAEGIRRFLHSTGLACAFMDFIVTLDGEYVFLEANPQGQFLWMEDRAEIPVLDAMSSYLLWGAVDFQFDPSQISSTWSEFKALWERGSLEEQVGKHVLARESMSVPE